MTTPKKLSDFFELKISFGSLAILFSQLVGGLVYLTVTLAHFNDVAAKVDAIQAALQAAKVEAAIQARDLSENARRLNLEEETLSKVVTHMGTLDQQQAAILSEMATLRSQKR